MSQISAVMNVMIKAARKAARGLQRDFGEVDALQISRKGAADFVSAADLKAEQTLFEELSTGRPKYGFVMEERGEVEGTDNSNRWIVDPLDGTTNFLHGMPHFAISIGLERDRQPYAGVIYNPVTDELFFAEKGAGAMIADGSGERRLRASGRSDLSESLFACGLPFKGLPGREQALNETNAVLEETAGIRRAGSAALDLAYVAAGRYDAYWERGLNAWDICAGIIIAREAGAVVTEIDGGGDPLNNQSILAANVDIHPQAVKLLKI